MKTKLLLLFILFSLAIKADIRNIWFTNSDTVNVGDSAWVEIKYTYTNSTDTCRIFISNSFGLWEVFKMPYGNIDLLKKYHTSNSTNALDSVTRLNFIVPNCNGGQSNYIASNQVPVYINTPTRIDVLYMIPEVKSIWYYDIFGRQRSEFELNELLIKATLYNNNTIKTQKIIYENH